MSFPKSILITGGCGFIGTSLIRSLLARDNPPRIRVLDNFEVGIPEDLGAVTPYIRAAADACHGLDGVVLVKGDIRDAKTMSQSATGVDCIVHLAANTGVGPSVQNPLLDMECNIIGTFNALEAAREHGVKSFIFASSGAPAGKVTPPIHEELPPHPVSPYGASKLAGEGYCSAYSLTFGIETVCLRFGNVYGPMSKKKSSLVAKFIRQALMGEPCEIYGDGTQTRDFIYIADLVRAICLAMEKDVAGETFQIATGAEMTIQEVAEKIKAALGRRGRRMEIVYTDPRLGDVKRNYADTSKAARMLGWACEMDIDQGIEATIDYFLHVGEKP